MRTTLTLTDEAVVRLRTVLDNQQAPDGALRVFVSPGGCSGFSYGMSLEAEPADDDEVVEQSGVKVVVDPFSLQYLERRADRLHRLADGRRLHRGQSERGQELRLRPELRYQLRRRRRQALSLEDALASRGAPVRGGLDRAWVREVLAAVVGQFTRRQPVRRAQDASRARGIRSRWRWPAGGAGDLRVLDQRGQCEVVTLDSFAAWSRAWAACSWKRCEVSPWPLGCERVWLSTTNDKTAALRFYQRRGWDLVALHRDVPRRLA